jgi:hypothetical protein
MFVNMRTDIALPYSAWQPTLTMFCTRAHPRIDSDEPKFANPLMLFFPPWPRKNPPTDKPEDMRTTARTDRDDPILNISTIDPLLPICTNDLTDILDPAFTKSITDTFCTEPTICNPRTDSLLPNLEVPRIDKVDPNSAAWNALT